MNDDADSQDPSAPDSDGNARTMNDDTTLDLLLARILDRRAAPADWDAFATLALARPEGWPQLLLALRAEQGLLRGTEAELAVAERVELPAGTAAETAPRAQTAAHGTPAGAVAPVTALPAGGARRPWVGWAAATVLALAWAGSAWRQPVASVPAMTPAAGQLVAADAGQHAASRGAPGAPTAPVTAPVTGPADGNPAALLAQASAPPGPRLRDPSAPPDAEDERVNIVGELPLQLVSSAQSPDGKGLDVLYVRPVLERTRVSGMYSLGLDDAGRPAPVSIHAASLLKTGSN